MKKKRNFLTIISSLFGIVAICGLSLFSLLDQKKESQIVDAVDYLNIDTFSDSRSLTYVSDDSENVGVDYSYTIEYNNYFDETMYYAFSINFSYKFLITRNNVDYEVVSNLSWDSFSFYSVVGRSNDILHNNSSFSLEFSVFYFQSVNVGTVNESHILTTRGKFYVNGVEVGTLRNNSSAYIYRVGTILTGSFDLSAYTLRNSGYVTFATGSLTIPETEHDYDVGYQNGYQSGYQDGYNSGLSEGYSNGYSQGVYQTETNYQMLIAQMESEYQQAVIDSYNQGYASGYTEGSDADSTASTILTGIFQVALVPINFFLGIFNFEILGINMASLVQAIFTIAITIILVKAVMGSKGE